MEEFIVFLFIVFCSAIGLLILWKLFDITRNSINKSKKSYDEDQFEKLAKAFIQHRKHTDKRLENIETILTGEQTSQQLEGLLPDQRIESADFNKNNKRRTT